MKILLKIVGVLFALLAVALLALYLSLNIIVARTITHFGPALTKTPVSVGLVSISPFSGEGTVHNLTIASPDNYQAQPAILITRAVLRIDLASLLTDRVVIKEIFLDAPEVNFEQKFTSNNISAIRKNVNDYVSQFDDQTKKQKRAARKFQINHLVINDGKARVGTGGAAILFPLSNVDRRNLGGREKGITSAELTQLVFETFTNSVLKGVASGALFKEGTKSIGEGIKGLFGN